MNKSQKAALFVVVTLLVAIVVGLVMYAAYSGSVETAVPLLVACVLIAFGLVIATFRITAAVRGSLNKLDQYGVPPNRALHALTLRQWLMLTVGLTVAAIGTGALTGVRVLMHDPDSPAVANPPVTAVATPPATTAPVVTAEPTTAAPTTSPAPSHDPTGTPLAESTDGATPAPQPNSTAYLDSSRTIDGSYTAKAVTFSAVRYPRSLQFSCSTATYTFLQWNVAGSAKFSTTAGIDDGTTETFGKLVELIFYDQDGRQLVAKPVEVSVGHPAKIEFPLTNVVSLRMTCAARDSKTNRATSTYAALGDAKVIY